MKKELLIHFTDVSVCLGNLKELGVKISPRCRNTIKLLHSSVMTVGAEMPQKVMAEICYRTANRIIRHIEMETDVKFKKYKLHNYLLSLPLRITAGGMRWLELEVETFKNK